MLDADEEAVDQAALVAHCRTHLAGYKCPKRIEFREGWRAPRPASCRSSSSAKSSGKATTAKSTKNR
ncbi:hypothetical protein [Aeromicrobium sp. UC242_57]|uniref:hypothetical protein n=1 Tax=Aeromicrobium sp. UC242_57 TaxID=3374624 RepID=UPI0037999DFE